MSLVTSYGPITRSAYQYIAERVYAYSRIRLGDDKQALVSGRLTKRLRQLNLESFDAYCDRLKSDTRGEEIEKLVDLISTNHTNFFREIDHIHFLSNTILPDWMPRLARNRETFRFWSAASSSGEEAYTVAIVLAEFVRTNGSHPWSIEASDISTRILTKARNAVYPAEHVRMPNPDYLQRYFQRGTGEYEGYYKVKDSLRNSVKFYHLNLLQPRYPVQPNQHVIFCRNVMIYFDQVTQQELVTKLIGQLALGGYLIVGHSETLLGVKHRLKTIKPGIYLKV